MEWGERLRRRHGQRAGDADGGVEASRDPVGQGRVSTSEEESVRQVSRLGGGDSEGGGGDGGQVKMKASRLGGGGSEGGGGDGGQIKMKAFGMEHFLAVMTPAGAAGQGGEARAAANLEQAGAASVGGFWNTVKQYNCNTTVGRPADEHARTCGRPLCLDPTGHGLDEPFLTETGPGGVTRASTCKGCRKTLWACDLPPLHFMNAKQGRPPRAGLYCRRCLSEKRGRTVYGSCPCSEIAPLSRSRLEHVSSVRDVKKLFTDAANPGDNSAEVSKLVNDTFMEVISELAKDAPKDPSGKQAVIIGVSVQKTSAAPLSELYSLWDGGGGGQPRAGMEAFRRTLGAQVPSRKGSNLLLAACGPVMPEAHACDGESDGQFGVLGKVLDGEPSLACAHCRAVPVHGLFTQATCAEHVPGGGRRAPANGQGSGLINSSCDVLGVWLFTPEAPLPAIVEKTPSMGWARIGNDNMGGCPHPRLAFGTSRSAIMKTRSAQERNPDVVWPREQRDAVLKRCREILGKNEHVTTFPSYSPKPLRHEPSSVGSDKATIRTALQNMQRAWPEWRGRALKIYKVLKANVYDRQDRNKSTWAELSSR